jgi:hypothetical protein
VFEEILDEVEIPAEMGTIRRFGNEFRRMYHALSGSTRLAPESLYLITF